MLDLVLGVANMPPAGAAFHCVQTLPFPLLPGNKLIVGQLRNGELDVLVDTKIIRRIGMGTYRMGYFVIPDGAVPMLSNIVIPPQGTGNS